MLKVILLFIYLIMIVKKDNFTKKNEIVDITSLNL